MIKLKCLYCGTEFYIYPPEDEKPHVVECFRPVGTLESSAGCRRNFAVQIKTHHEVTYFSLEEETIHPVEEHDG